MGFKIQKLAFFLALLLTTGLSAQNKQEQKDSLVRLIKGSSLKMVQQNGENYRMAKDATFLHNDTYLVCDTAYWHVDNKVIDALGHVKVIQDGTTLSGDKGSYLIDMDLVQFRGTMVQLEDKDHNILRTHDLDYNTKDSLAYFSHGASMKDKHGQIIESRDGSYDAKKKVFEFRNNVNMFTDSVFIRTTRLNYESEFNRAIFPVDIDFWKDDNMLSAESGWYERNDETFFFTGRVHAQSPAQEGWCDTLYYYRTPNNILMLGEVQVQDTTRNVAAVGRRMFYVDSLAQVTLTKDASVVLFTEEKQKKDSVETVKRDTLYAGADLLAYRTIKKCDIPPGVVAASESRLSDMNSDPVMEYRRKAAAAAAEAARKAAEENADNNPELAAKKAAEAAAKKKGKSIAIPGEAPPEEKSLPPDEKTVPPSESSPEDDAGAAQPVSESPELAAAMPAMPDTLQKPVLKDSLMLPAKDSLAMPKDSLTMAKDSLALLTPPDTTKIGFAWAVGNVKVFRRDIQVACDSLRYNDLDSTARLYVNPIVWNDGRRQYTADSLAILVKGQSVDRASLMGNAFIITQETDKLFDQIKSTEVMAWFDSTAALRRFDALGGASAIFFLKEKEEYSLVNKIESKMMSAYMANGELQRNLLFDSSNNNAHPLPQVKVEERKLKGFNWQPELQPKGKEDITDIEVRPTERKRYDKRPRSVFDQTDIYFPGYMKKVYGEIAAAKEREKQREEQKKLASEEVAAKDTLARADSLLARPDSLQTVTDSLGRQLPKDSLSVSDSLKTLTPKDSLAISDASTGKAPADSLSPKERRRLQKIAEKEAKWARADSLDAVRAAEKLAKKKAKEEARAARLAKKQAEEDVKDAIRLQQYVEKYRKKYDEEQARLAEKKKKEESKQTDNPPETNEDGTDPGQIPALRESGHAEQRGVGKPTLDSQTVEPSEAPVQRTE